MIRALQAADTRRQGADAESRDSDVASTFRFLWDTYKAILDILRSNARLEECYHETARLAFEFCRVNKRNMEFKRLSEMLRKNHEQLDRRSGPARGDQVNPSSVDTIQRTLESRLIQL